MKVAKVRVAGSNPVVRSEKLLLSAGVSVVDPSLLTLRSPESPSKSVSAQCAAGSESRRSGRGCASLPRAKRVTSPDVYENYRR
jgi:hypothetical protein